MTGKLTNRLPGRIWLVLFLLAVCHNVSAQDEANPGSIEGIVLEENGNPLKAATVYVCTLAHTPWATTDETGRFLLKNVPSYDDLGVCAFKASEGYPYNLFSFYIMPGAKMPHVAVRPSETTTGVVIQMGAKAAKLRVSISDGNGSPVAANLGFSRPDLDLARPDVQGYGDYGSSIPPGGEILVPPVPFRLTVEADGYEPWHYASETDPHDDMIRPKSGETITLVVKLARVHPTRDRKNGDNSDPSARSGASGPAARWRR